MSLLEIILRLVVVGLLGAYLVSRQRRRAREAPPPVEDPAVWNGHPIEARTLRPRLEQVRRDYRAVPRGLPGRPEALKHRSACARRQVSSLAYFRHQHVEEETEHQIA